MIAAKCFARQPTGKRDLTKRHLAECKPRNHDGRAYARPSRS